MEVKREKVEEVAVCPVTAVWNCAVMKGILEILPFSETYGYLN